MRIISHRGYWKTPSEKNTTVAFNRSFGLNFGTETDVRDYCGKLVISHDMATADCIGLVDFLEIYKKHGCTEPLAINIKADGLQKELKRILVEHAIVNYFVFDMSVPDTIGYLKNDIPFYSRQSEYEPAPAFYDICAGVWLDSFNDIWYTPGLIEQHVQKGKKVAIVSPELHGRDTGKLWGMLKNSDIHKIEDVILCTDIPEDAKEYFNF
jgi:glycerophosphoryl diester phosphodiesterase